MSLLKQSNIGLFRQTIYFYIELKEGPEKRHTQMITRFIIELRVIKKIKMFS